MASIRNQKTKTVTGTVVINSNTYEWLKIHRTIWILDPKHNGEGTTKTIARFSNREELLLKFPNAVFSVEE